jgi:chromosome segregation ATPase
MQDEEAAMRLAHQQRMGELQAEVLRLRQQLEQQQAEQQQTTDARLQSALTEAAALRQRVAQQEQAFSALSSAMEDKEKARLRLQDDKSLLDTELAHAKATAEALSATKTTLEASNASLNQANARLESELALLKTNFDAAPAVKAKYSDPVDSWSQARREIGSTEDSLYTRLRDYEKRLSKVCFFCVASLYVVCRVEGCLYVCARALAGASA